MEKFLLYWPFSDILPIHYRKEQGGLYRSFEELGFESYLLVGNNSLKDKNMKILETSNSDVSKISSYINEFKKATLALTQINPSLLMVNNTSPILPAIIIYYKLFLRLKKRNLQKPKLILELDIDPTNLIRKSTMFKFPYILVTLLNSILFDVVVVQSTCAYNAGKKLLFQRNKLKVVKFGYHKTDVKKDNKLLDKKTKTVLSVSRVSRDKGIDILVKAFAIAHDKFQDWDLIIVGPILERNYYNELIQLIKFSKLEHFIKIVGEVNEEQLSYYYDIASIFASLSRKEGYPVARTEALARGIPSVISEAGCGIDLTNFGAIVVPVEDVQLSSIALKKLMQSSELRQNLRDKAKDYARDWNYVASELMHI